MMWRLILDIPSVPRGEAAPTGEAALMAVLVVCVCVIAAILVRNRRGGR